MPRPWSRAGRVVLIEDVTHSDRPRLEKYRPPAPIWPVVAVSLTGLALVALVAIVARVL